MPDNSDSEFYMLVKCLAAIVTAATLIITAIVVANMFLDSFTFSEERYKLETERLQLQQKLCTPENLITEEGN